jgi:S-adenosylmethionine/arginine decarboxylase-like enzyme
MDALKRERYGIENVTVVYFSKSKRRDGKAAYTMTMTLSESHMTVHGYTERGTMAFDFYTCRGRSAGWSVFEEITNNLDLGYYGLVSLERNVD